MNCDLYVVVVTFNDFPNVIHFSKFMMDSKGVPLSMEFLHPRLNCPVRVIYRGVSSLGKKIYRYSEGHRAGEALGG